MGNGELNPLAGTYLLLDVQVPSPPVEALQNHQWSLVVVQLSGVVPGLSRRAGHLSSLKCLVADLKDLAVWLILVVFLRLFQFSATRIANEFFLMSSRALFTSMFCGSAVKRVSLSGLLPTLTNNCSGRIRSLPLHILYVCNMSC